MRTPQTIAAEAQSVIDQARDACVLFSHETVCALCVEFMTSLAALLPPAPDLSALDPAA